MASKGSFGPHPFMPDLPCYQRIAGNYAQAIQQSGVRRVVYLSSIGAHLAEGSGIIVGHHRGEAILSTLSGVAITFVRPVACHYNLRSTNFPSIYPLVILSGHPVSAKVRIYVVHAFQDQRLPVGGAVVVHGQNFVL